LKKNDVPIGNRIRVRIAKNKVAPPFKIVEVDLLFNEGISKELDLLDAALHYKVIMQAGSWFSLGEEKIAQGRDQVLQYLKANNEITQKIYQKVMEIIEAQRELV